MYPNLLYLEPGSNRLTVGLGNISARKIIVPSKTIVCQIQLANMIPPTQTSKEQPPTEIKKEDDPCILDQLDLGEINSWSEEQQHAARKLICDYTETFSKNDLDLGKCTGGSRLSRTAVKPDSHLAQIFFLPNFFA